MNSIEEKEAVFHDNWADSTSISEVFVDQAFESRSSPENRQIIQWMGSIKGKKILEIGCGLGEASVYFAKQGAQVTATDISPKMVEKAQELAKFHKTSVEGRVVSANNLDNIPDNYFDFSYAGNLLHHVEIIKCVTLLKPKLKEGGIAFFWDPIAYNPVINVYRKLATKVRTDDEHPLKLNDIQTIKSVFSKVELEYFWLTSLGIFLWYFLVKKVDPNKERYWKKILQDADEISHFLKITQGIDRFLFKVFPPFRYLAWNVVIKAQK
jgi:SAM-dependent methyltransferase